MPPYVEAAGSIVTDLYSAAAQAAALANQQLFCNRFEIKHVQLLPSIYNTLNFAVHSAKAGGTEKNMKSAGEQCAFRQIVRSHVNFRVISTVARTAQKSVFGILFMFMIVIMLMVVAAGNAVAFAVGSAFFAGIVVIDSRFNSFFRKNGAMKLCGGKTF